MNKIKVFLLENKFQVSVFILIILHVVGIVGILFDKTRNLVLPLTPANLIIGILLLLWNHEKKLDNIAAYFFVSFSVGMGVEILGVQTGFPFGEYAYGANLGGKLAGVPFIIGLNWFYLTYVFAVIWKRVPQIWLRWNMIALSMVIFDLLLEAIAPALDFWQFDHDTVPIKNYISWYLVSLGLAWAGDRLRIVTANKLAPYLIIVQSIFFLIILFWF